MRAQDPLLRRLASLALLTPGEWKPRRGRPSAELLRLCDQGALVGGLTVSLDVRPDELIGALCTAMGGAATKLRVMDVREQPSQEIIVSFEGREEGWDVPSLTALVHNLNDLFREDAEARTIADLGEWEDSLQLWCLPKRVLTKVLREAFFEPRNREVLEQVARAQPSS